MNLVTTAVVFLAVPTAPHVCGQSQKDGFEVASIKQIPSGKAGLMSIGPYGTGMFTVTNATLEFLIELAFNVPDSQIAGQPNWLGSEHYSIAAKAEGDVRLSYEQLKPRLQRLLAQRFKLAVHRDTRDSSGYALLVSKSGTKLQEGTGGTEQSMILPGGLRCPNVSMDTFAAILAKPLGRPVANQTGIKGEYNIRLDYARDADTDSKLPSIFTALQEQLGLKVEQRKVPVEMLVIDHVERVPTEN